MLKIKNKSFFSKGKRGIIYVGSVGNKKVAIKQKNPRSKAIGRIKNETSWLRLLNKKNIGPKFVAFEDNSLIYEFAEGDFVLDWIKKNNFKKIKKILRNILIQCRELDKLMVNKEEMHNPVKHIVIGKKVTLLDFERCKKTRKPQNVTQFCQFIMSYKLKRILTKKGFNIENKKLILILKKYKKSYNQKEFNEILNVLKV